MGWRGTLRSFAAASRRIEREQQRRRRELLKHQQQVEELQSHERAAVEVAMYENHIDLLTSVHKDCGETWDWQRVRNSAPPAKPEYSNQLEVIQRQREARHPPGFIARLFGQLEAKRAASQKTIEEAIAADQTRHAVEATLNGDVEVIHEFMWMFGDKDSGVEYYKHSITRRYLLLHRDGRCFQQSLNGLVEVDFGTDLRRVREHPEEGR